MTTGTSKKPELREVAIGDLHHLRRNPQFILAPVLVRPNPKKNGGGYEILSGNHRIMAAREVGLTSVPAIVAKISDKDAQRIAVNLNTVHGDPTPELLAPFLAEMDDDVLASVHLDKDLTRELKQFDADLSQQLASLDAPPSVDRDSVTAPTPSCACPTCGRRHAPKE